MSSSRAAPASAARGWRMAARTNSGCSGAINCARSASNSAAAASALAVAAATFCAAACVWAPSSPDIRMPASAAAAAVPWIGIDMAVLALRRVEVPPVEPLEVELAGHLRVVQREVVVDLCAALHVEG